jgi:hypothetical protein
MFGDEDETRTKQHFLWRNNNGKIVAVISKLRSALLSPSRNNRAPGTAIVLRVVDCSRILIVLWPIKPNIVQTYFSPSVSRSHLAGIPTSTFDISPKTILPSRDSEAVVQIVTRPRTICNEDTAFPTIMTHFSLKLVPPWRLNRAAGEN